MRYPRLYQHRFSIFGAVSFAVIGLVVLLRVFAATGYLYLSPNTATVLVNNTISVDVRGHTYGEHIKAVGATVNFDTSKLRLAGWNSTGSVFSNVTVSSSGGQAFVSASSSTLVAGEFKAASLVFQALVGSGSTTLSISNGSMTRASDNANIFGLADGAIYNFSSPPSSPPTPPAPQPTSPTPQPQTPPVPPTPPTPPGVVPSTPPSTLQPPSSQSNPTSHSSTKQPTIILKTSPPGAPPAPSSTSTSVPISELPWIATSPPIEVGATTEVSQSTPELGAGQSVASSGKSKLVVSLLVGVFSAATVFIVVRNRRNTDPQAQFEQVVTDYSTVLDGGELSNPEATPPAVSSQETPSHNTHKYPWA